MLRVCLILAITLFCVGHAARATTLPDATLMDEAFQAAQWAHLSSAGAAVQQTAARRAAGDDALATLLQQRQIVLDRIARAETQLATLGGTEAGGDLSKAAELGGEIQAAQSDLDLLDARLAQDHPEYRQLLQPEALRIADVQASLGADEGLIFIFTGKWQTHVWAITPDRAAWHRIDLAQVNIESSVTEIRNSLIQANTLRAAAALDDAPDEGVPYAATDAMVLYFEILGPLEPYLEDVKHLYSVVDGPLSGLPLSLLITDWLENAQNLSLPEDYRRVNWMFQRYTLTTLPSVESLILVKDAAGTETDTQNQSFLGIGDPDFAGSLSTPSDGTFFRGTTADLESLRALAPLPGTRRELIKLARLFNADDDAILLGTDATETALRNMPLDQASVIAFATHGLLSGELRGLAEPALALTPPAEISATDDGLLTASEITSLQLNADWVVLSACNTAGSDGTPDAEGLSGLARAFLFAGARTLMVSHWPVRDDAAEQLTTSTFDALNSGTARRKSEALQSAMQTMLMDESQPDLSHPAAWAPFVLVGHGG
ncbi:MAG: CHAT domain-containing protein [Paracoccaceae bacterium]